MKRFFLCIALVFPALLSFSQIKEIDTYLSENEGYFANLNFSSQGLVFTNNFGDNIYLLRKNGELEEVLRGNNIGRYMTLSENGKIIGYKTIDKQGYQHALNYSVNTKKRHINQSFEKLCGTTDAHDNFQAWTNGSQLHIRRNQQTETYQLPGYINLIKISPDGRMAAYAWQDNMYIMQLETNSSIKISQDDIASFYPEWSPDSRKLLYVSGQLIFIYDIHTGTTKTFKGNNPSWKGNTSILYQKNEIREMRFFGSDLYLYDFTSDKSTQLTNTAEICEMNPVFHDGYVYYHTYNQREIKKARLLNAQISEIQILYSHPEPLEITHYSAGRANSRALVYIGPCPYIHQLYDTPGFHNGNGSCAPTTSTMALAYYNRVPEWPTEVDHGYSMDPHISNYGSYIADKFRFNETYFDDYSSTKVAWGGYAHMWVTNASPGTNGMYSFHDILNMDEDLYQDWTTNIYFSDITDEIDAGYVFPVCSWITMSGHLTLAVGYLDDQHTIVFNDPWGDKNTTGYPSYDGQDSYYDWPGYNNGYENLDPDGSHGGVAWTVNARTSEPVYNDTIIDSNFYGHGFHLNNYENGSHQKYFHDYNGGYGNHFWYTITMDDVTDIAWVSWTPNLPEAGNYEIKAYIPSMHATANNAEYQISHAEGNSTVFIDQSMYSDEWVSLGEFSFNAGQSASVTLGDNTGTDAQDIAFDAMWWSKTSDPIEISSTNLNCFEDNSGTASVIINDTHIPHIIEWSNGAEESSISGLAAGEISVTVTNALDQTFFATTEISQPSVLVMDHQIINPYSSGSNDGCIELFVSGGTPPYEFIWSNLESTNPLTNLSAGEYHVTVSDDKACSINETFSLNDDCEAITDLVVTALDWSSINISWTENPEAEQYIIQYSEAGSYNWTEATSINSPAIISGLAAETSYDIRVASQCGILNASWQYGNVSTNVLSDYTSTACSGIITDSGGESEEYGDNENYTFVISPADADQIILNFKQIEIEADWDTLFIYDGNSVDDPLITYFSGDYIDNTSELQGKSVLSTGSELCLHFKSDNLTTEGGWLAEWYSYGGSCSDNFSGELLTNLTNTWATESFIATANESDNTAISHRFSCIYNMDSESEAGIYMQPESGYFIDKTSQLLMGWQNVSGNWIIENNMLSQTDESESNTNLYFEVNQSSSDAFLYEMDILIDGNGTNRRGGFHFACDAPAESNRGNSYMIYLRPDQDAIQLYEYIDNSMNLRCSDVFTFESGIQYNVKVSFDKLSGKISAFIDDQLISSWTDSSPIQNGSALSLRSGNALVQYQNIKLYSLSENNFQIEVGDDPEYIWETQNSSPENPAGIIERCIINENQHIYQYILEQNIDYTIPSSPYNLQIENASNDTVYSNHLDISWSPSEDSHSGISHYEISLGENACSDNILNWQQTDNSTSITMSDLSIENGEEYFLNIRSINNAGLVSDCISQSFLFEIPSHLETNSEASINIYPNPASDWIVIDSEQEISEANIISTDGKVCQKIISPTGKNALNAFKNGEYDIILTLSNGRCVTKRLIIAK